MVLHVARALDVVGLERAALELVEDGAKRLLHHVGEHVEPPAVGHADDDLFDAELAAALDDLLQRRYHGFRAVDAEALGASVLHLAELLERLRLDQLVEDRAPPLGREADVLLLALDAVLDPAFCAGLGDVHELHTDVPAIGAAQDAQDLAHGRRLETEHAVDEDRPVEVGIREAVGLGLELAVHLAVGEAERIEIGGEMAHDAVGADQHQRADRILRGAQRGGRRHLESEHVRALLQVVAERALRRAVVAGERRDELAVLSSCSIGRPQARAAARRSRDDLAILVQALEEVAPLVADGAGVALVLRLHLLDVGGIGAAQERGAQEPVIERVGESWKYLCLNERIAAGKPLRDRPGSGCGRHPIQCAAQHTPTRPLWHDEIALLGRPSAWSPARPGWRDGDAGASAWRRACRRPCPCRRR